uniref:Growth factor receptor bound protein 10 n=1 Tax=Varanus komodoensis TaxID=61221 RepID=A0A8D2J665_VARKO
MALAGCPDSFLHHPYRIDSVDQTSAHTRRDLVEPGFQEQSNRILLSHQGDDDVDLEALVNDMNSSFESLYSTYSMHSESTPLLQNGQLNRNQPPASGTNSLHPVSPRQKVQRSQPVRIMAVRRLQEEEQQFRTSSLPAIPNPFPELCSPASSPVLAPGSLPQSQPATKQDVKVFSEDGTCKVVEILADMTARDLCQLLVYKSHCVDDNSWTLVEHHPLLGLERCLEDHELVVQVESTMGSESKFLFRKNYAKYEFFKNPVNFFPEQMVAWCQQSNGCIPQSQLLQNFLNSSSCPEIQGFLHVKELGRKSWKKLYACLRRSGLYCSTKGSSKEPRHLQLLADLEDSNIFSLIAGKKMYNAPTDYGFCIKPNRVRNETKELRLLCAEDEQSRTCWMTAFRLLKYGMLLYQNYRIPQQRTALLPHFTTPVRSVSENSLVAMDFSGQIGRVIENPAEAQSAALEEGHAWRVREPLCQTGSCGNLKRLTAILTQCLTAKPEQWSKRRADDNIASSSMTVDVGNALSNLMPLVVAGEIATSHASIAGDGCVRKEGSAACPDAHIPISIPLFALIASSNNISVLFIQYFQPALLPRLQDISSPPHQSLG